MADYRENEVSGLKEIPLSISSRRPFRRAKFSKRRLPPQTRRRHTYDTLLYLSLPLLAVLLCGYNRNFRIPKGQFCITAGVVRFFPGTDEKEQFQERSGVRGGLSGRAGTGSDHRGQTILLRFYTVIQLDLSVEDTFNLSLAARSEIPGRGTRKISVIGLIPRAAGADD